MILVSKGLGGRGYDATVMLRLCMRVKPEDGLVRGEARGVIDKSEAVS